jgi:hypothetical protein
MPFPSSPRRTHKSMCVGRNVIVKTVVQIDALTTVPPLMSSGNCVNKVNVNSDFFLSVLFFLKKNEKKDGAKGREEKRKREKKKE